MKGVSLDKFINDDLNLSKEDFYGKSEGGDSGGIVYGVYHNTDTNTSTNCVAGVHRGKLGGYAVFSKITEVIREMGVSPY